ncbi:hypothetical protein M501DRAFT_1000316 [Patellaria atrata CBS 101060]|uniref:Apple domain-containing protein n=1 Tax=Patellaria atrata CBS 101060 TaxID=1346257 RepID=A0A9P4VTQ4_9PEZI|nr:hypothetical protein M501DRAFT_1000316 [Patellaria atrata CBS 101060]
MIFSYLLPLAGLSTLVLGQAQQCGINGYDRGRNPAIYFAANTTAPQCKNICAILEGLSFATSTAEECLVYNVTVTGNVIPVISSPYTFYDAPCDLLPPEEVLKARQAEPSCNVLGYDNGLIPAYYYLNSTDSAECKAACTAQECVSFASGADECFLYNMTVTDTVVAMDTSPYAFYDAACEVPATPPTGVARRQVAPLCAQPGWDKGGDVVAYGYYSGITIETCKTACVSRTCGSFAYGSNTCYLYNSTVTDTINFDPTSPINFYDPACDVMTPAPSPTPVTPPA